MDALLLQSQVYALQIKTMEDYMDGPWRLPNLSQFIGPRKQAKPVNILEPSFGGSPVRYIDMKYRLSIYRHFWKISISISIRTILKISISISILENIDIDKDYLENIDIDKDILKNIDKGILQIINIDEILYR